MLYLALVSLIYHSKNTKTEITLIFEIVLIFLACCQIFR